MKKNDDVFPDLTLLRGVVAPEILQAAETVVPLPMLIYMKLKAGRQKDIADLVELLKRGRIEIQDVDRYLQEHAPQQIRRWERTKEIAASEE